MSDSPGRSRLKTVLSRFAPFLGGALFLAALIVLRHALRKYHYHEIIAHIRNLPAHDVLTALLLTAAGYFVLTGYDTISIYYIRRTLAYRRTAFASYVAYSLSHSIGASAISGGGVRYRLYSSWGLSAKEVAKVVMFNGITFWVGFTFMGTLIFLSRPMPVPTELHLPVSSDFVAGLICLLVVLSYLAVCLIRKKPVRVLGMEFEVPSLDICLAQVSVSSLDWLLAGSVLFMLLRHDLRLPYPDFIGIFLFAQIAGLASQAPGGLGVFEMVSLIMLSPYAPPASVLGSLLVFRGIYYILPMIAGILMLGTQEALRNKEFFKTAALSASRAAPILLPDLAGIAVFVAGAILLVTGAVPAVPGRMSALSALLPLPAVETAHIMAGLTGIVLLFLARGLQRRIKNAYSLSVLALFFGIVFSLMRAFDYEEAIFLFVVLAGILPFPRLFYRTAPLKSQTLSTGWLLAAGLVIISSAAVGLFVYRHVHYTREMWLEFGYYADAARFFRTTVGAAAALVFIAAGIALGRKAPRLVLHGMEEIPDAPKIACRTGQTPSHLTFHENARAMTTEEPGAFLPVAQGERVNICLGEPVGPPSARTELAWRFIESGSREIRPAFYDAPSGNLQFYLDMGLTLTKVSEEARAPIADDLPGMVSPEEAGFDFGYFEGGMAALPGDARAVFEHETGPSEGPLIKNLPVAALIKDGLAAIAHVWQCEAKSELFPVVIRIRPGADALMPILAGIYRHGMEKGFKWLNLGTAPLYTEEGAGAFKDLPYTHREHFDLLCNLRKFKDKFNPVWEPRYLASPPGLPPEEVLRELASIFGGRNQ